MHEGSWGAEGNNQVWMNPETSWTYTHIYPAELYTREVCTAGHWRNFATGKRIMQQLCRELLLLESSDWQFLITTGAARDYAEIRFLTHNDQFNEVKAIWQTFESTGTITQEQETRLAEIELRDGVFPDIDPSMWVAGAHEIRPELATEQAPHLTEAPPKSRAAVKPRTLSDEAAKRTAADSTKFDGVNQEPAVPAHTPKEP
jgi:1,4-alpha-glucan branching enzyme